jgi:CelD/BcsL family acetyltransferase involved in cellulose biosynthesis
LTATTNIEPVADAVAEWEALADATGASPFVHPGWILAWHRCFGAGELVLATLRRDGHLAAALPLVRRGGTLASPSDIHTPVFGPVAPDEATAVALLEGLLRRHDDALELRLVAPESVALVRRAAAVTGHRTIDRPLPSQPYADLSGGWEAYRRTLSKNRRKDVRRRTRRLEELGTIGFRVEDGRTDLERLYDTFVRLEDSGWKGRRGSAIASRPAWRRFYLDVSAWAASRGMLRLVFLDLDDRPLAADLAVVHGGTWYALKGGYDPAYRDYAPGLLSLYRTVEHACELGLTRLELLGAPERYKLDWTHGMNPRAWLAAYPPTLAGRARYAAVRARERARPLAWRALRAARRVRAVASARGRGR